MRTATVSDSVRQWLHDYLLTFCFIGQVIIGVLVVTALNRQNDLQAQWNDYVQVIAQWQGPTSLTTHGTRGDRPFTLGLQEARRPDGAEIGSLVQRQDDALTKIAEHR